MLFIEKLLVLFPYFVLGLLQSSYFAGYENSFGLYLKETNFNAGGVLDIKMVDIFTKTLPLFISVFISSLIRNYIENEYEIKGTPLLDSSGVLLGIIIVVFLYSVKTYNTLDYYPIIMIFTILIFILFQELNTIKKN